MFWSFWNKPFKLLLAEDQVGDALWEGTNDVSESDLSSSEIASEGEEPLIGGDIDFASAVARAAEMAGMTVVGSTVTDSLKNEHIKGENSCKDTFVFVTLSPVMLRTSYFDNSV